MGKIKKGIIILLCSLLLETVVSTTVPEGDYSICVDIENEDIRIN